MEIIIYIIVINNIKNYRIQFLYTQVFFSFFLLNLIILYISLTFKCFDVKEKADIDFFFSVPLLLFTKEEQGGERASNILDFELTIQLNSYIEKIEKNLSKIFQRTCVICPESQLARILLWIRKEILIKNKLKCRNRVKIDVTI